MTNRTNSLYVGAILAALTACQPDGPPALSLEEAKKATASFEGRSFAPPPKTIADVAVLLDQHKKMDPETAKAIQDNHRRADQKPSPSLRGLELSSFLLDRGIAAKQSGRVGQAIEDLRRAKELSEGTTGTNRREILWELASAEARGGNIQSALRMRVEAVAMVSNPFRATGYTSILAMIQAASGDLDAAEASLANAELHMRDARNQRNWIRIGDNFVYRLEWAKAAVERRKGRNTQAEQLFRSALATALAANTRSIRDVQNRISLRSALAKLLSRQGRHIEAEVEIRRAVQDSLKEFGRYSQLTNTRLSALISVLIEQSRYGEAEKLAGIVLDTYAKIGAEESSYYYNFTRVRLADIKVNQGRWADALPLYDVAERKIGKQTYVQRRLLTTNLTRIIHGRRMI